MEEATRLDTVLQRRIGILVYEDLEATYDHLVRVFSLGPGELTRALDGRIVHGEIEAGYGVLLIHPESPQLGLASPKRAGVATAMVAVIVDDVEAHFRRVAAEGADIVYEPVRSTVQIPRIRCARQ